MKTITRAEVDAMAALEQLPTPPDEAKYVAQDADGRWFAYATQPEINGTRGMWTVVDTQRGDYFRLTCRVAGEKTQEPSELYKII